MEECIDERLKEKFEFYAACLLAAFIPFCFAPSGITLTIAPEYYELIRLFVP